VPAITPDLNLRDVVEPPIVADDSKLEHSALMQDLEWDLSTGQDPELRRLMRSGSRRPSTAPVRRAAQSSRPSHSSISGAGAEGTDHPTIKAKSPQHPWNMDDFEVGGSSLGTFKSKRPTASAPPGGRRRRSSALVGEVSAQLNQRQEAWVSRTSRERGRKTLAHAAARAAEERMEVQRHQEAEEHQRLEEEKLDASDPRRVLEAAQTRERRMRALSRTATSSGSRLPSTREAEERGLDGDVSDDNRYRQTPASATVASARGAAERASSLAREELPANGSGLLVSGAQAATHRRTMPMARRDWSAPGRWIVDVVGAIDS
jgi:hypothetical protein